MDRRGSIVGAGELRTVSCISRSNNGIEQSARRWSGGRLGKRRSLIGLLLASALLAGCSSSRPAESGDETATTAPSRSTDASGTPRLEPDGNFVLYVSNQSFDMDPVDISIEIDGVRVIERSFEVKDQHNWKEFALQLTPGSHEIRAHSARGAATLTRSFVVDGKHWAVVDFWYNDGTSGTPTDPMFTFAIDDEPIRFACGGRSERGLEPRMQASQHTEGVRSHLVARR